MFNIIAEIGINHNGNINIAKTLIDQAKKTNCWAVKFQKKNPDICVPQKQKNIIKKTPWGNIKYIDYKYKTEFGKKEYDIIDEYCNKKNINWSVSVWDLDSLEFIKQYNIPFIKIPSAKIIDKKLVSESAKYCKEKNIKFIASTGMSTKNEIFNLFKMVDKFELSKEDFILMHCNSAYPCDNDKLNLKIIQKLIKIFPKCTIGYSDHSQSILPCVTAYILGAKYIEKHITLDKNMWGSDQKSAMEFEEMNLLYNYLYSVNESLGNEIIKINDNEKKIRKKLRGI